MRTKSLKAPNVSAGYRLPKSLVTRIRMKAASEGVQPCRVAERLLIAGFRSDSQGDVVPDVDSPTSPSPSPSA